MHSHFHWNLPGAHSDSSAKPLISVPELQSAHTAPMALWLCCTSIVTRVLEEPNTECLPNVMAQSPYQSSGHFLSAFSAFSNFPLASLTRNRWKLDEKLHFSGLDFTSAIHNTLCGLQLQLSGPIYFNWELDLIKHTSGSLSIWLFYCSECRMPLIKLASLSALTRKWFFDRNSACLHWCFCFQTTVWCYKRTKLTETRGKVSAEFQKQNVRIANDFNKKVVKN